MFMKLTTRLCWSKFCATGSQDIPTRTFGSIRDWTCNDLVQFEIELAMTRAGQVVTCNKQCLIDIATIWWKMIMTWRSIYICMPPLETDDDYQEIQETVPDLDARDDESWVYAQHNFYCISWWDSHWQNKQVNPVDCAPLQCCKRTNLAIHTAIGDIGSIQ